MRTQIAFTTCRAVPSLAGDDRLAIPALGALGIDVVPWIWEDPAPPPGIAALVHRSCWDYHEKPAAFRRWLATLGGGPIASHNPEPIVRWNLDKRYLKDLADRGVRIPETAWIAEGERVDLAALLRDRDLDEVVIKPQISLSAFATSRASRAGAAAAQADLDARTSERAMMVQAFLPEIMEQGELSLVFFGGEHSHTVRKRARPGDFRVQHDHGGSRELIHASPALVEEAKRILAAVGAPLLYARVDVVETGEGVVLMELEAIDPELYLAMAPGAAERFAGAIAAALGG
jgi:glutathione synthase/RimK-type ligase-like ATP-grasp enzyme